MIIKTKQTKLDSLSFAKHQFTSTTILLAVLSVLVVALGIPDWIKLGFKGTFYDVLTIVYSILTIGVIICYVFLYNKMKKSDKISSDTTYNYFEFDEANNLINVKCEKDEQEIGVSKLYFNQIHKILETKKYFYIFISASQMMLIRKEDLDSEALTYVGNILKQKVSNYKTKR